MNKVVKWIIFWIVALTIFAAVSSVFLENILSGGKVFIDNPTDKEITVRLDDGEDMKIPAGENEKIKIEQGKHEVFLNGKSVWTFERWAMEKNAVINPTKGEYIIWVISYEYTPNSTPEVVLPKGEATYYGLEFEGYFRKSNDLYINQNVDYSLDEKFPEEITTFSRKRRSSKKYELKSKIYRIEDYILENFEITKEELEKEKKEFMAENGENTGATETPTTLETPTTQTGVTE